MDSTIGAARNHACAVRLILETLHGDARSVEQRALITSALRRLDVLTALLSEAWPSAGRSHLGA